MKTSDTSARKAIVINKKDNVATAISTRSKGETITLQGVTLSLKSDIPFGHKFALKSIKAGESVIKYGEQIGVATTDISLGEHVHTHNLESTRGRGDKVKGTALPSPR